MEWEVSTAVKGGNKDLVDFFIGKGANNWNVGIKIAVYGNCKELVELFTIKMELNKLKSSITFLILSQVW